MSIKQRDNDAYATFPTAKLCGSGKALGIGSTQIGALLNKAPETLVASPYDRVAVSFVPTRILTFSAIVCFCFDVTVA
jgi:hypothetical protein